jgi:sugar lactone lactonase YvrE
MKSTGLLTAITFALPSIVSAAVEVIIGAPVTEPVSEPFSVDFDKKGALYGVEFSKSNRVFKWADGKLEFIAGVQHDNEGTRKVENLGDGPDPLKAWFNGMHDIQITPDGKAVIGDSFSHVIREIDLATGAVKTLAGTGKAGFGGDGGPAKDASFNVTMTGTLSPDRKRLLIADIGNHRVREIDLAEGTVRTVAGNGQKGNPTDGINSLKASMGDARAVTEADDGTLYVLLRGGNSLVEVKGGKVKTVVNAAGKKGYGGDGGDAREALMNGPKYVAMDRKGNVLICDTENHCVRRYFPKTGKIELVAGNPGKATNLVGDTFLKTGLRRPHGVRIGPEGKLYIADTYNNRVLRGENH